MFLGRVNRPCQPSGTPPVAASRRYLQHLAAAWENAFPDAPIREQQVVLTVPASFDASGRELTREAAITAGLPDNLALLEEPQSAVYAWLADRGDRWRRELKVGDTLLICDVGGGTSDFTLVRVDREGDRVQFTRTTVGRHLLLGGDNLDLTISQPQRFAVPVMASAVGSDRDRSSSTRPGPPPTWRRAV